MDDGDNGRRATGDVGFAILHSQTFDAVGKMVPLDAAHCIRENSLKHGNVKVFCGGTHACVTKIESLLNNKRLQRWKNLEWMGLGLGGWRSRPWLVLRFLFIFRDPSFLVAHWPNESAN